jgi:Icc-related predicted phosphoesterase
LAVKIISDIHGEYGALADQLEPGDTAVLLGDYVNLIDFQTLEGILSDVYSREQVARALELFAKGDPHEARRRVREVVGSSSEQSARIGQLVAESYRLLFDSIPCRCIMIYGNTDNPWLIKEIGGGKVEMVEAGVVAVEGQRFAMLSGSPHGPWTVGLPGEIEPAEYERRVAELEPADVLCTHYPPAVPELTWDELAGRDEAGSDALLDYIDRYEPSVHYFGHVHHPRVATAVRGRTRLINAGFFREHGTALLHDG